MSSDDLEPQQEQEAASSRDESAPAPASNEAPERAEAKAQSDEELPDEPELVSAPEEPPMSLRVLGALLVGLALGVFFASGGPEQAPSADSHAGHEHAQSGAQADEPTTWTCSMHPQVESDEPGDCPICGMELIPASKLDEGGAELEADQITLSPRAKALAGVRAAPVEQRALEGAALRLLGRVVPSEDRRARVTAWTGGRIERLKVQTTGEVIRRGQIVAQLYSPEIYAAHRELLSAEDQLDRLSNADEYTRRAAGRTLEAARRKLSLLGITDRELERMAKAQEPWQRVPVRARVSGTVMTQLVEEGQWVTPGQPLHELAELGRVWVELDAYESDLPRVALGQRAALEVAALPGQVFDGQITFIDPTVDDRDRTTQLRVEVDNADGQLKPGMYVEARLGPQPGAPDDEAPLVIPRTAPLFTGRRSLVYVEVPGREVPTYEAREIALGARVGEHYPVLTGLEQGERVVVYGAFILDADLQLRGGLGMMSRPDDTERGERAEPLDVSEAYHQGVRPVVEAYLQIQEALAADELEPARQAARRALEAARDFEPPESRGPAARLWTRTELRLEPALSSIAEAEALAPARRDFEQATRALRQLIERAGNPLEQPLRLAHCPMALEDRGAEWFQRGDQIDNVYFGDQMRRCGSIRQTIGAGERAREAGDGGEQ